MRKKLSAVLLVLAVAITAYYATVVANARNQTQEIFAASMAVVSSDLTPAELGEQRVAWLLQAQDPNFYHHGGTDFSSGVNTTVTQALVKVLYFEHYQPGYSAKLRQSLIARYALDAEITKDDQLTLFINMVYMGSGKVVGSRHRQPIRGLPAAAQYYYGKSIQNLNDDEYLSLLVMFSAPNKTDPLRFPEVNQELVAAFKADTPNRS